MCVEDNRIFPLSFQFFVQVVGGCINTMKTTYLLRFLLITSCLQITSKHLKNLLIDSFSFLCASISLTFDGLVEIKI